MWEEINTECREGLGIDYRGTQSKTSSGQVCQRWDMSSPQQHQRIFPDMFGERSVSDAHNYCRNPGYDYKSYGPWCYTMNPRVRHESCNIPFCRKIHFYVCIQQ